jgi:hypothetical protein
VQVKEGSQVDVNVVTNTAEVTRISQQREAALQRNKTVQRTQLQNIEVVVDMGPGALKRVVVVSVDRGDAAPKRYLGGYRHKQTGAVYHHAGTQTPKAAAASTAHKLRSRDCQTTTVKTRGVQNVREACTQMARPDVLLDESEDRVVLPGAYVTAEERERCGSQSSHSHGKTVIFSDFEVSSSWSFSRLQAHLWAP